MVDKGMMGQCRWITMGILGVRRDKLKNERIWQMIIWYGEVWMID